MPFFDFLKKKEIKEIKELKRQLEKYKPLINIDKELEKRRIELKELSGKYNSNVEKYKELRSEVSVYESNLESIEVGIYEPIYDFETSEEYKKKLQEVILKQKALIKENKATLCSTEWKIQGSIAKGEANTKRFSKLMLRAFNGEANTIISKVKWNNFEQVKLRIEKSHIAINKLGEKQDIKILSKYKELKIEELHLEYEYQLKKQEEKEEQRRIKEEIREEEKAKREYEKAQKQAEKEERDYQKALDIARKEIESQTGENQAKLNEKIRKLELALEEASSNKERALSMAQQTKRGHVYVISNLGSFGEDVYKIGMTRRLEPLDRVKELGDASVPFKFDVHAMIFSNDAPALEKSLHKSFKDKSVNMLNFRKEFFNVSLQDIQNKVKELEVEADFQILAEAKEYRETLAIIRKLNSVDENKSLEDDVNDKFPPMII